MFMFSGDLQRPNAAAHEASLDRHRDLREFLAQYWSTICLLSTEFLNRIVGRALELLLFNSKLLLERILLYLWEQECRDQVTCNDCVVALPVGGSGCESDPTNLWHQLREWQRRRSRFASSLSAPCKSKNIKSLNRTELLNAWDYSNFFMHVGRTFLSTHSFYTSNNLQSIQTQPSQKL